MHSTRSRKKYNRALKKSDISATRRKQPRQSASPPPRCMRLLFRPRARPCQTTSSSATLYLLCAGSTTFSLISLFLFCKRLLIRERARAGLIVRLECSARPAYTPRRLEESASSIYTANETRGELLLSVCYSLSPLSGWLLSVCIVIRALCVHTCV